MKIVIDIPKHAYEECKEMGVSKELEGVPFHIIKAVADGKPLPKGHGRLIDADEYTRLFSANLNFKIEGEYIAPTIIEADKEAGNEVSN